MKLSELLDIHPALVALAETKLPVKAAYRVARALKACRPSIETFHEARAKLAAELGRLSKDGQRYEFDDGGAAFGAQVRELLEEDAGDIELPKIQLAELGDVKIEPLHLAALDGTVIVGGEG